MAARSDKFIGLWATAKRRAGPIWSVYGFLFVCSLLFWSLRLVYWRLTQEAPFSDIMGYVTTGYNIVRDFFFGVSENRPTYYTPITPALIALAKLIAPISFEDAFHILVQAITFVAALGVCREIALLTGKKWLGASFFLIVAICRPSIFWSLKLSTEPVCEAFLYASAAAALATVRTRAWYWAALCGVLALCLGLNRPGFLLGTMFIPLAFLIQGYSAATGPTIPTEGDGSRPKRSLLSRISGLDRRAVLIASAFLACFFGMWSIWIGRNLINYGVFIPTSSTGAQSALWDYQGAPVRIGRYDALTLSDGSKFSKFENITEEADRYPRDYEGAQRLVMIARAWYAANWKDLPRVFLWRLKHIVANRGANGLTQVPREHLFIAPTPDHNNPYTLTAWTDLILLDKTPFLCFIALGGLGLFAWKFPVPGLVLTGLALMPWFMSAAVIGYERTVEALIATTIWFALFGITEAALLLNRREAVQQRG